LREEWSKERETLVEVSLILDFLNQNEVRVAGLQEF
jgi:hypothetical protein